MKVEIPIDAPPKRPGRKIIGFSIGDVGHVFYDNYHYECRHQDWPNGGKWFYHLTERAK